MISKRLCESCGASIAASSRKAWADGSCPSPDARESALAVVHLRFFAGGELEAVELLGRFALEAADEALDAVVAMLKSVAIHQLLENRLGIALEPDLFFDPRAVGLARRAGVSRDRALHLTQPADPVAGVEEFEGARTEPVAMGEFEVSPPGNFPAIAAYLRIVLRSMPVLRWISCCETPLSISVMTVVCWFGFKTFTSCYPPLIG